MGADRVLAILSLLTLILGVGCTNSPPGFTVYYHRPGGSAVEVTAPIDEQLCTRLLQAVEEAPDRLQLLVLDETMEEVRRAGAVEVRFESVVQRRPRVGPTLSFSALLLAVPEDSSALKRSLRQVIFWGEDDFASGPLALAEPSLPDEIRALLADGGYLPR